MLLLEQQRSLMASGVLLLFAFVLACSQQVLQAGLLKPSRQPLAD